MMVFFFFKGRNIRCRWSRSCYGGIDSQWIDLVRYVRIRRLAFPRTAQQSQVFTRSSARGARNALRAAVSASRIQNRKEPENVADLSEAQRCGRRFRSGHGLRETVLVPVGRRLR